MRRDRIRARLAGFARADKGVAAVEFALVLPFLLLLFLGGWELTNAASTYRKVTDTTAQLADIVSQYTSMSSTDVNSVFSATTQIMYPDTTNNLQIVLSEISTNANNVATVTWSQAYNGGAPLTAGSSFTLPSGLALPNTSYIYVQSSYMYTPTIGSMYISNIPMKTSLFVLPRETSSIAYTG
jgi:Flp pilus assembly protein TadG